MAAHGTAKGIAMGRKIDPIKELERQASASTVGKRQRLAREAGCLGDRGRFAGAVAPLLRH